VSATGARVDVVLRQRGALGSRLLDRITLGVETLETVVACSLTDAFTLLSGRGVLSPNCPPSEKNASQPDAWSELEGTETAR
jgi:hypothetical protein